MIIKIIEQAQRRRDIADWIEDKTLPIMEALTQLYLFPNTEYINHWRQEVWSNLNKMKALSGKNKLPSKEFILKSGWEVNKKYVQDCIDFIVDKERNLNPVDNIDLQTLTNLMETYFTWAAEKLSQKPFLTSREVYSELEELGL